MRLMTAPVPPLPLVGDGLMVPCVDGIERPYLSFDTAASTSALPSVYQRVQEFVPLYSSVHRGAGYKSQLATAAYERARHAMLSFANHDGRDDIAIICRNTTEAINHLAYRLRLRHEDVVLTTVVEHHANLLPWRRVANCRFIECGGTGTFEIGAVEKALDQTPIPRILTITGASNITGWMPPLEHIVSAAHHRGIPVVLDAAQLAPHRPIPQDVDFVAFSGHKMYAPFGAGVLIGPRATFTDGDPFLAGGGAVDLVDLNDVTWTTPPDREEAGSPNVIGAVALHGAIDALGAIGWPTLIAHDRRIARLLREGLQGTEGVRLLGPSTETDTLPVATFVVEDIPHALVAARLSAENAIGVRHGCFCAHPYLIRLLGLSHEDVARYREEIRRGDHRHAPGAVRASAGINTTEEDVRRLLDAVARLASGQPSSVEYRQDPRSGDYTPIAELADWQEELRRHGSSCSLG
jgi:selenocysteine lyase/cysteine desulfurase